MEEATVKQTHARILRETLAKISNVRYRITSAYANEGLKRYAEAVKPYCTHPETVLVQQENREACLDCGERMN